MYNKYETYKHIVDFKIIVNFPGDGPTIPGPNWCDSNPCMSRGNCTSLLNNFQCNCFSPYTGRRCENSRHQNYSIDDLSLIFMYTYIDKYKILLLCIAQENDTGPAYQARKHISGSPQNILFKYYSEYVNFCQLTVFLLLLLVH